jgi:hypothetical protein
MDAMQAQIATAEQAAEQARREVEQARREARKAREAADARAAAMERERVERAAWPLWRRLREAMARR